MSPSGQGAIGRDFKSDIPTMVHAEMPPISLACPPRRDDKSPGRNHRSFLARVPQAYGWSNPVINAPPLRNGAGLENRKILNEAYLVCPIFADD
jgi:hypothetical protein